MSSLCRLAAEQIAASGAPERVLRHSSPPESALVMNVSRSEKKAAIRSARRGSSPALAAAWCM